MSKVLVNKDEIEVQRNYCALIKGLVRSSDFFSSEFPSYLIQTYGCQLNESDSEKLAGYFELMGFKSDSKTPDIFVLNTCSIRKNAQERLFGHLGQFKHLKSKHPKLIFIVCGCMMMQKENLKRLRKHFSFVDIVFGPQDIHKLPEFFYFFLSTGKRGAFVGQKDYLPDDFDLPVLRQRRFRALVPIMYGCNNFCTYCVVPYTRGRERSRDFRQIMTQLEQLSKEGYQEIMLLGQNVNSYGTDLHGAPEFPDLLNEIAQKDLFYRIRFMTSHPKDVSSRLIDVIAANPSIERHLHLPVQSGSNDVLRRMNRGYTRESYINTALLFREKVPDGTISTDLIVGFPGESETDFDQSLDLMKCVHFDFAFTFIYSKRPGTAAAEDPLEISQSVVSERFSRLLTLQNQHSLASNQSVIGTLSELLIEGASHTSDSIYTGRTSSNRLVNFSMPENALPEDISIYSDHSIGDQLEGRRAMVRLLNAKTFSILGELEYFINE